MSRTYIGKRIIHFINCVRKLDLKKSGSLSHATGGWGSKLIKNLILTPETVKVLKNDGKTFIWAMVL